MWNVDVRYIDDRRCRMRHVALKMGYESKMVMDAKCAMSSMTIDDNDLDLE